MPTREASKKGAPRESSEIDSLVRCSGSHDRAIQPAVIPAAATRALVRELGGKLLVQIDSSQRALAK